MQNHSTNKQIKDRNKKAGFRKPLTTGKERKDHAHNGKSKQDKSPENKGVHKNHIRSVADMSQDFEKSGIRFDKLSVFKTIVYAVQATEQKCDKPNRIDRNL